MAITQKLSTLEKCKNKQSRLFISCSIETNNRHYLFSIDRSIDWPTIDIEPSTLMNNRDYLFPSADTTVNNGGFVHWFVVVERSLIAWQPCDPLRLSLGPLLLVWSLGKVNTVLPGHARPWGRLTHCAPSYLDNPVTLTSIAGTRYHDTTECAVPPPNKRFSKHWTDRNHKTNIYDIQSRLQD